MRAALLVGVCCFGLIPVGCGGHLQNDGPYALTATEVQRDTCGLLATPESLWDGRFEKIGDLVRMPFELFDLELTGAYAEEVERFYLDGVAREPTATVAGQTCRLEYASVNLVGETQSPSTFTGTLQVLYESNEAGCRCELVTSYRAVQQ